MEREKAVAELRSVIREVKLLTKRRPKKAGKKVNG